MSSVNPQSTDSKFRPVRVVYQIPGTVQTTKILRTPAALTFQRRFCERHLIEIHETPLSAADLAEEGKSKRLVGIGVVAIALITAGATAIGAIKANSTSSCTTITSSAAMSAVPATQAVKYGDREAWALASPAGGLWVTTADPGSEISGLILPLNQAARSESEAGVNVPLSAPIYRGASATDRAAQRALACTR